MKKTLEKTLDFLTDKKIIFSIALIFLVAFSVRAYLAPNEYLYGFDSYYHARLTQSVIETGLMPATDTLGYYTLNRAINDPALMYYINAFLYNLFTGKSTVDNPLDLIAIVKFFPAFMGALSAIAMFFLGRELAGNRAGLFCAFLIAVIPSHVYRSMAGFFEEDALGMLFMIIFFAFAVRAMKKTETSSQVKNAGLAGLFVLLTVLTWKNFIYGAGIFGGFVAVQSAIDFARGQKRDLATPSLVIVLSFAVFSFLFSSNMFFLGATGFALIGYLFAAFFQCLTSRGITMQGLLGSARRGKAGKGKAGKGNESNEDKEKTKGTEESEEAGETKETGQIKGKDIREPEKKSVGLAAASGGVKSLETLHLALLVLVVVGLVVSGGVIVDKVIDFVSISYNTSILGQTIGEENMGISSFPLKYNGIFALFVLGLVLLPLKMIKDKKSLYAFALVIAISTVYLAFMKLKFTYLFGPALAVIGGIALNEVLEVSKKKNITKYAGVLFVGFMLLMGVSSGVYFVSTKNTDLDNDKDWVGALDFLRESTPEGSTTVSWWDYGHWITFVGQRKALIDNTNAHGGTVAQVARFLLEPDLNSTKAFLEKNKVDYIVLNKRMFGTYRAFASIGFNAPQSDRQVTRYAGRYSDCTAEDNLFVCGGKAYSSEDLSVYPSKWTNRPAGIERGVPFFVYRADDSDALYAINSYLNETLLAKLFFKADDVPFELVFDSPSVKIYKV